MICKNCTTNIPDAARFCPKCGIRVEGPERPLKAEGQKDVILCPKCGTPSPITAKFCRKDGSSLRDKIGLPEPKEVKQEAITEPKPGEKPAETKEEAKLPEKVVEIDKPSDVIRPRCGAPASVTEIFCKKDSTLLKEEIKPAEIVVPGNKMGEPVRPEIKGGILPDDQVRKEVSRRPMRIWIWLTVFVLFFTIAGVGSYLSFSGLIRKKPGKVTGTPEASKPPLPPHTPQKVEPEIEKPLPREPKGEVATLTVPVPEVQPVDIKMLERNINISLRNRGLRDIYVEITTDLIATLVGTTGSQEERNSALSIARSYKEIKEVRDNIQMRQVVLPHPPPPPVDKAKLEGDINRALRRSGLMGVSAEVSDDLSVVLKGSTGSAEEKNRAFAIAKSFKKAKGIRDIIFIVEH